MTGLMEKPSKHLPKWVTDFEYPNRAEDLKNELVSHHFWSVWKGREDELAETYVKERAEAEAHMRAVENASSLEDAVHQATMSIIYTISEKQWYKYAEYEDLIAFLHDRLRGYETRMEERGGDELPGSFYEVKNLMSIIKHLENLGVPKEKVLGIRHNLSKAKQASKEMKKILSSDIPEKDKKESILDVLDDVVNPNVSVKEYRGKNKERSIEQAKAHLPMNGNIYMVQGMELLLIESPDKGSTRAVELSLNGLVDGWEIRDGSSLIRKLTERVYSKQKFKPARIVYAEHNNPRLKFGDGGWPMPTRSHLQAIILEELGHNQRLVDQLLLANGLCWLPLYEIQGHLKKPDIHEWLTEHFIFKPRDGKTSYGIMRQAVDDYYLLPEDILEYFDGPIPRIQMVWTQRSLGIDLRIQIE